MNDLQGFAYLTVCTIVALSFVEAWQYPVS
jgi:hypothetical protein